MVVDTPPYYRWQQRTLLLFCHIQPGASATRFAGQHGERLKITLQAPPVDGRANVALLQFLAKQFAVPKSRVQITSGDSSRQKTVAIAEPQQLPTALAIQSMPAD